METNKTSKATRQEADKAVEIRISLYDDCYILLKSLQAGIDILKVAAGNPNEGVEGESLDYFCYSLEYKVTELLKLLDKWDALRKGAANERTDSRPAPRDDSSYNGHSRQAARHE